MALAKRAPSESRGNEHPRIAPPVPARSGAKEFAELASSLGITLYPWQTFASRYLTAKGPDGRWLYPELAVIVGRQNGKTKLLVPLIVGRLLEGRKIMHAAQNAKLPREVHDEVAMLLQEHYPERLPKKRAVSYAVGHEEIRVNGGGWYRIVAPTKSGARGPANDLVIVDELREMDDHDFIAAAEPTLSSSPDPQIVYLSNAGSDSSMVLNAIKKRAEDGDPPLAYLEWSASPERPADDRPGWLEANPAYGYMPGKADYLARKFESYRLSNELSIWETEHLCRWVVTMRERLVDAFAWTRCEAQEPMPTGRHPSLGIAWDPSGSRAALAAAWPMGDQIGLRILIDGRGENQSPDAFAKDVRELQMKLGAHKVGFDPLTDSGVAKHLKGAEPIGGGKVGQAAPQFVNAIEGTRIRWQDVDAVTDDLTFTARKQNDERGSFEAVRANDDRPITAVLAAIRAVWLASGPRPPVPKVYVR